MTKLAKLGALIVLPLTIKVDTDNLVQAITAGMISGPHGYGYWCEDVVMGRRFASAPKETYDNNVALNVINGGSAIFKCFDDDGTRYEKTLSMTSLMKGLALWLATYHGAGGTYDPTTGVMELNIDAPSSDMIMQYALFGEQKYG